MIASIGAALHVVALTTLLGAGAARADELRLPQTAAEHDAMAKGYAPGSSRGSSPQPQRQ